MDIVPGVIVFIVVVILLGVGASILAQFEQKDLIEVGEHVYTPNQKVSLGDPDYRVRTNTGTIIDCTKSVESDLIETLHCGTIEISGLNANNSTEYHEQPDFGYWADQNIVTIDTTCKHTYTDGVLTLRLTRAESQPSSFMYINELNRNNAYQWKAPSFESSCPQIESAIENQIDIDDQVKSSYTLLGVITVVIAGVIVMTIIRSDLFG